MWTCCLVVSCYLRIYQLFVPLLRHLKVLILLMNTLVRLDLVLLTFDYVNISLCDNSSLLRFLFHYFIYIHILFQFSFCHLWTVWLLFKIILINQFVLIICLHLSFLHSWKIIWLQIIFFCNLLRFYYIFNRPSLYLWINFSILIYIFNNIIFINLYFIRGYFINLLLL